MKVVLLPLLASFLCLKLAANELPANLQVVLLSKLMPYEKVLAKKSNISVYVVNNQNVFQAFKLLKAKQQNQQLGQIDYGNKLPKTGYDIVYIDKHIDLSEALLYSFKFTSLLVTNDIERVKQGITLGLSLKSGRPMFFLNKRSSDAIGLSWDPTVLDIATLYN